MVMFMTRRFRTFPTRGSKMNNKARSTLTTLQQGAVAVFAAIMLLAVPVAGNAQEQTSSMRGTISNADGSPAAGATVRVTDTRTGGGRSTTANDRGVFQASALRIGGPYTVAISAPGQTAQTITDVFVALGDTYTFDVTLSTESIEEIVVTASALNTVSVALGPSNTFTLDELESAPSINRDITDVVRIDSRIHVSESGSRGDSIHCGGANNRFNSLTVDGVRLLLFHCAIWCI